MDCEPTWPVRISTIFQRPLTVPSTALTASNCLTLGLCKGTVKESKSATAGGMVTEWNPCWQWAVRDNSGVLHTLHCHCEETEPISDEGINRLQTSQPCSNIQCGALRIGISPHPPPTHPPPPKKKKHSHDTVTKLPIAHPWRRVENMICVLPRVTHCIALLTVLLYWTRFWGHRTVVCAMTEQWGVCYIIWFTPNVNP